jgi:integrase
MRRSNEDRIYGPYKHGQRWRVVRRTASGDTFTESFDEQTLAEAVVEAARSRVAGRTVKQAVDLWLASKRADGISEATLTRDEYHLDAILQMPKNGARKVTWLRSRGAELYDASRAGKAVDTHRNGLKVARAFGRFCVKQSLLTSSPFADVEGKGRRKTGKPQISIDESRKLYAFCMTAIAEAATPYHRSEATAVLAVLLLGPRATEVTRRAVRDLDDGGRVLWIRRSKTEAGRRHLEVPDDLRPLLLELARDKIGAAPLFTDREGKAPTRHWLNHHCKRICKAAGVPVIPPHGLRGTHSSIAKRGGATGAIVSAQLGHAIAIPEVTDRAYVRKEANQAASTGAVVALMERR